MATSSISSRIASLDGKDFKREIESLVNKKDLNDKKNYDRFGKK